MKKIMLVSTLAFLILPQVVFAAWWNPLSWQVWSIFKKETVVNEQPFNNENEQKISDQEKEIQGLKDEINKMKDGGVEKTPVKQSVQTKPQPTPTKTKVATPIATPQVQVTQTQDTTNEANKLAQE